MLASQPDGQTDRQTLFIYVGTRLEHWENQTTPRTTGKFQLSPDILWFQDPWGRVWGRLPHGNTHGSQATV